MDNQMGGGEMMKGKTCGCPHHWIAPAALVLSALAALLGNWGVLDMSLTNWVWPVLLGVAGVMGLMEGKCKCC